MSLQESDARSLGNRFSTEEDTANIHHGNTKNQPKTKYENAFHQILAALKKQLKQSHFKFSVAGEESQFTRFNGAKVRQTGQVCDSKMTLTLISEESISERISSAESTATKPTLKEESSLAELEAGYRTTTLSLPFVGEFETDWQSLKPALESLQTELINLPIDPYVVLPSADDRTPRAHHSREIYAGKLLQPSQLIEALLSPVQSLDFSGLYAGGQAYRGYADSAGKQHWFETPSFTLDYSLFEQVGESKAAVKGTLAGHQWTQNDYEQSIATAQEQLTMSARARKQLQKGRYSTYLAPAAVADIIDTIACGGGLGEAALRQGNSPFSRLEKGEAVLSSQFSLGEDFQRVGRPRFNADGEIAPMQLPVVQHGRWVEALVNGRSEQEYGKPSNGANGAEALRAASVAPGNLPEKDVLRALDTGLYVSNVHYLNWSDLTAGHITGMTRYACFWVENGEVIAPIENLRFDDDLYRFLGEGLIALTDRQTFVPAVGTYERRSLGGMWVPGMLINDFRYTL
ncbi:MAG: metallopeptidase TldD-related protein [Cyanobacteria bacterium J06621_11]